MTTARPVFGVGTHVEHVSLPRCSTDPRPLTGVVLGTMQTKLTRLQVEMLLHRLESGAIESVWADTQADSRAGDSREEYDAIYAAEYEAAGPAVERVAEHIRTFDSLPEVQPDSIEAFVLADAISGSTWIGCMIEQESEQKIGQHLTVGMKLAELVSVATGETVEFPKS